jgi:DNA replication and repair protein RecF
MVAWGEEVSRISAKITNHKSQAPNTNNEDEETKLELVLTTGMVQGQRAPMKKYLVNGVARRQVDFVGNLHTVLFSPEDLDLVTDSPSLRRNYLNSVLEQVDREYRRNLFSYEKGLRQRNKLLFLINEGKASRSQLLFWNQLLIKAGTYITESRRRFIESVNTFIFDDLTYHITYDPSIISEYRFLQYKEEEVAAKTTLVGPQRDDFRFEKTQDNEHETKQILRDVSRFGSRGEQRLAVLWLKLAELTFVEKETGTRPILLLDDIFSELDTESRDIVLSIIKEQQTIITSAEDEAIVLVKKHDHAMVIELPLK